MRASAVLIFLLYTGLSVVRDMPVVASWLEMVLFSIEDPNAYLTNMTYIFTGVATVAYAMVILSPWVRLKLIHMFEVWYLGILGGFITTIFFLGFLATIFLMAFFSYAIILYALIENPDFARILAEGKTFDDLFFGLTKQDLLNVAELSIQMIAFGFLFLVVHIGLLFFIQDAVVPSWKAVTNTKPTISSKTAQLLLGLGFVLSALTVLWHLEVYRNYADLGMAKEPMPPTLDETEPVLIFGYEKHDVLAILELIVILFFAPIMVQGGRAIYQALVLTPISTFWRWPEDQVISKRYIVWGHVGVLLIIYLIIPIRFVLSP